MGGGSSYHQLDIIIKHNNALTPRAVEIFVRMQMAFYYY